jgi:photosystem II stability/assembly factor-like uncharacterized protein
MSAMLLLIALLFMQLKDNAPWWSVQPSVSDANLRGVSVVLATGKNDPPQYIIWASGSDGVILRSVDEGSTWRQISVPDADGLDFRDIEAFSADEAYVMSSGEGKKSRVYKTTDGGKTWKLQYSGTTPGFFLDSMACDSETHCVAVSDPVNDKFVVLSTHDGEHWSELPQDRMPPALAKEGAFAASGTAIALCDRDGIYFGTGGPAARVFRSFDQGRSWTVSNTPIVSGSASSGIFSIACDGDDLVAVGGDYKNEESNKRVAIYSNDAGSTWHLAEAQPGGYRSAVASFSYGDFAAVGPNGTDISHDKGIHWQHTDKLNLNAIAFKGTNGWGVGPKGTLARFKTHFEYRIRREDNSRVVGAAR